MLNAAAEKQNLQETGRLSRKEQRNGGNRGEKKEDGARKASVYVIKANSGGEEEREREQVARERVCACMSSYCPFISSQFNFHGYKPREEKKKRKKATPFSLFLFPTLLGLFQINS